MAVNPDFKDLFAELSAHKARFMIVGAHAVIFYSMPRYTKDLDVWVDPEPENAARTYAALESFGAPLHDLGIEDLATPGIIFQIGVEPNRIDILTDIAGIDFAQAWPRAAESTYGDQSIRILGREDLIHAKETAGRDQDLLDLKWLKNTD